MMSDDVECPYCGEGQEICHDDGFGYDEDALHEQCCYHCEKNFVFQTIISFDYYPQKADCLNGFSHTLQPSITYPKESTKMVCKNCDYSRVPTVDEMNIILEKEKR